MFLPSESVFSECTALARSGGKMPRHARLSGFAQHMALTLNTVRAIMRDVKMREQAGLIQNEVRVLMEDVSRLNDRIGKLRTHFGQAEKDIELIETSGRKITSRGERITGVELEDKTEDGQKIGLICPTLGRLIHRTKNSGSMSRGASAWPRSACHRRIVKLTANRHAMGQPRDGKRQGCQHVGNIMRGCLPLDRGVGCQNNLAHAVGLQRAAGRQGSTLRPDTVQSRQRAAQHMIAPVQGFGTLKRPQIADIFHHADNRTVAARVGANGARVLRVDIAANIAGFYGIARAANAAVNGSSSASRRRIRVKTARRAERNKPGQAR